MGSLLAGIYQNATRPNGYVSPLDQKMGVGVGSTGAGTGMVLGAPGGMVPMQPRPQDYGMNMLPPLPVNVRYPTLASIYQRSRMPNYEQGFNSSLLRGTSAPTGYTSTSGM